MVEFSQYTMPMDRDYGRPAVDDTSTNDVGVGVKDIGMSVPMGIAAANVQGVAAKIRQGAGSLEIGFPGVVRGQRGAHTPGMYGEDQRQALRELAKIAEVNLTTHAAYGIMGLAGIDQQGNFSKEQKKLAVDEIKRAIEFAADTAQGGSVVVHTGEFQRPISEEPWAVRPDGTHQFMQYGEEPERAVIRVVDDRTGQVMTQVRKNQKVARPIWNKYEEDNKEYWGKRKGGSYTDANGKTVGPGDYIDYEGNKVNMRDRVPIYDKNTGRFKVKMQEWNDFVNEAEERNKIEAEERGISLQEFKLKHPDEYLYPEEAFLRATLETNEGHSRGWALYYAHDFDKAKEQIVKLKKALNFWKKIEDKTPEEEKWTLKQQARDELSQLSVGIPPEFKLPSQAIEDALRGIEHRMEYEHQASVSQEQTADDSRETQKHVMSARKYALKESYDSYAEAGMHAMDITRQKKLEKPLMITMENIFPESYGAHPDELKNLIENSRKKMAERLIKERGVSQEAAKKTAETHIKATLDTGHFNLWRKYWQNNPKRSMEQNDKDFKNWMLKKTEELAKANMIGNVHLADNYGYQDDHLSPGQGTTPVKEIVSILKKHGYKGALTVEPGADASTDLSDFHGLMKTWRLFGSPVYGAHAPVGRTDWKKQSWSDIQYSYFGQTNPPYYIFGPYSPSQDWTLWSQVPME